MDHTLEKAGARDFPEYGILKECWIQHRSTQELGNPTCVIAAKGTALRNDDKKVPAKFRLDAWASVLWYVFVYASRKIS